MRNTALPGRARAAEYRATWARARARTHRGNQCGGRYFTPQPSASRCRFSPLSVNFRCAPTRARVPVICEPRLHLRTLLLALLCTAAVGTGAGARTPLPEAGPRPGALRAAEAPAQPFLATTGILVDGFTGVSTAPQPPRELHLGEGRDRGIHRAVARHCDRNRLAFARSVRQSRFSGLHRFGGTPPPALHV